MQLLWIFETDTLRTMLSDAKHVARSTNNDKTAREYAALVVKDINDELTARANAVERAHQ